MATVVAFHAHPDDEVLLTGGTLARLAAEGPPITHRVDVRRFAAQKQAALAAHRTAVYGRGRTARLFRLAIRLPVPVFGLVAGREWYAEPGARTARPIGDVLQPAAPATGPAQGTVRR